MFLGTKPHQGEKVVNQRNEGIKEKKRRKEKPRTSRASQEPPTPEIDCLPFPGRGERTMALPATDTDVKQGASLD